MFTICIHLYSFNSTSFDSPWSQFGITVKWWFSPSHHRITRIPVKWWFGEFIPNHLVVALTDGWFCPKKPLKGGGHVPYRWETAVHGCQVGNFPGAQIEDQLRSFSVAFEIHQQFFFCNMILAAANIFPWHIFFGQTVWIRGIHIAWTFGPWDLWQGDEKQNIEKEIKVPWEP